MHIEQYLIAAAALVTLCASLWCFSRRYRYSLWSPVYGIAGFYTVAGLGGYLYYRYSREYVGGFYDLRVSDHNLWLGVLGWSTCTAAFCTGAALYSIASPALISTSKWAREKRQDSVGSALRPWFALALCITPFWLIAIGAGVESIVIRDVYLPIQYQYVKIVGDLLVFPAIWTVGFAQARSRSTRWRLVWIAVLLLYEVLFLSLGTRKVVIAPFFYLFGMALGTSNRRQILWLLLIFLALLPATIQVPLILRGMDQQGLLPLTENLQQVFADTLQGYLIGLDLFARNAFFGVPLTGYIQSAPPIHSDLLIASLNPLPSFVPLSGVPSWEQIGDRLRYSTYIPYNAIGELLNYSWILALTYFALAGILAAAVHRRLVNLSDLPASWIYMVTNGLMLLFAVTSTQYNLRSSSRLLYYAVVLIFLGEVVRRMFVQIPSSVVTSPKPLK